MSRLRGVQIIGEGYVEKKNLFINHNYNVYIIRKNCICIKYNN